MNVAAIKREIVRKAKQGGQSIKVKTYPSRRRRRRTYSLYSCFVLLFSYLLTVGVIVGGDKRGKKTLPFS